MRADGVTKEAAARFGLPCGGNPRLGQQPLTDLGWVDEVLVRTAQHERVACWLERSSHALTIETASRGAHTAVVALAQKQPLQVAPDAAEASRA